MIDDDSPAISAGTEDAAPGAPENLAEPQAAESPRPKRKPATRAPRRTKATAAPVEKVASDATEPIVESRATIAAAPDEPAAPAGDASEAPVKPARRRATRSRKVAPITEESSAVAEPAVPVEAAETPVATEQPAPAEGTAPPEAAEAAEPASKPRRRRAPRRKAAGGEPVVEAEMAAGIAPSEEPSASEPAMPASDQPAGEAPDDAAAPRRRRSRGGRRRSGRGKAAAEGAAPLTGEAEGEEPAESLPAEAPPAEAEAQPVPAKRPRRAARKTVTEEEPVAGARIAVRHGLPEIVVNGRSLPPVLFFGNLDSAKQMHVVTEEVRRAAHAGVHIHSTLIELVCPIPPDDTVYEQVDDRLRAILEVDSDAFLVPRLVFVPAPGWRQQYPNEVTRYADGASDDPSIASDLFWGEAEVALRALIQHVDHTTYADRVIGFHLERGEWFHPADTGYDRSFANREAFRQWLRARYRNSEVALRAGWYDGAVQFYTAEIPEGQRKPRPEVAFFESRKERRWIDFLEFTSETAADRLISLGRAVKDASANRCLVSVCYGYTFEFGHTYSGHLALSRLLASPAIDIIAGPPSYRDREPGGAGSLPSPVDSFAVHGKLWVSEDDTRTYLAPAVANDDDFNPRIGTREATEQVHRRASGQALAHQTGIGWMDLWGDGWLNSDDVWAVPARFSEICEATLKHRRAVSPEVVVLVDERSLTHVQRGDAFVRRILQSQRATMLTSGASVGMYLQSDVLARGFPTDAKLYIFLTPYRLPADQRVAIREKLHNGGKTLVWLYAVGVCDDRTSAEEGATDPVGISLRQQAWNAEIGSKFVASAHPLAENLGNRTMGVRERLNPSFYVADDDGVTVIAEYQQTGLPSIAVREFPRWRSVFCGEPELSPEFLRNLCRYAGVHLYTTGGDDYVYAGNGWLTLHAIKDGHRTIYLPAGMDLYDVTGRTLLAEGASDFRVHIRANTSRVFFVGQREDMVKLGLPSVAPTRGRGRGKAVAIEAAPAFIEPLPPPDPEIADSDVIDTDGLHQMVRESMADAVADTAEMQEISETPEAVAKRRRRRRGGRGRGRRGRPGDGSSQAGSEPPPPAVA